MHNIQLCILEDKTIDSVERLMCTAARLTQHGEAVHSAADLKALHDRPLSPRLIHNLVGLPHPTLQKFGTITIGIVGASRRFLAQITRHQNEVKFMSASLQYSDYSDDAQFVVPYGLLEREQTCDPECVTDYLRECNHSYAVYKELIADGCDRDDAAYLLPQGLRGALLICATPYEWKHMIRQRICRRNSPETRYIMLQCWSILATACPLLFEDIGDCGAFCQRGHCEEGSMTCGHPISKEWGPDNILQEDFPLMYETYQVSAFKDLP